MYAGFWKRTAAYLLDYIIYMTAVWIINVIVGITLALFIPSLAQTPASSFSPLLLGYALIPLAIYLFYYVYLESSPWQATPGKLALGIKVTDLNGNRISFWRSLGRHAGELVSSLTMCIGYLMCGWTAHKQCLHDMMANCLVVDRNYDPHQTQAAAKTPGWAIAVAVLGTILTLSLLLGIACAITLPEFTKNVEKSRVAVIVGKLQQAAAAQQQYRMANGSYARRWKQLEIPPMQDIASNIYCVDGPQEYSPKTPFEGCGGKPTWVFMLEPRQVTAWRVNSWKYRIVLPYQQLNAPSCQAKDKAGQAFCQTFNKQQNPKEGLPR